MTPETETPPIPPSPVNPLDRIKERLRQVDKARAVGFAATPLVLFGAGVASSEALIHATAPVLKIMPEEARQLFGAARIGLQVYAAGARTTRYYLIPHMIRHTGRQIKNTVVTKIEKGDRGKRVLDKARETKARVEAKSAEYPRASRAAQAFAKHTATRVAIKGIEKSPQLARLALKAKTIHFRAAFKAINLPEYAGWFLSGVTRGSDFLPDHTDIHTPIHIEHPTAQPLHPDVGLSTHPPTETNTPTPPPPSETSHFNAEPSETPRGAPTQSPTSTQTPRTYFAEPTEIPSSPPLPQHSVHLPDIVKPQK